MDAKYKVEPGRVISLDGLPLVEIGNEKNLKPWQVDWLARKIAALLNEAAVVIPARITEEAP